MGEVESTTWTPGQSPVAGFSLTAGGTMESRRLCAYNQTRECFLGLEVAAADLSLAEPQGLCWEVALKSGEGLWMAPFRGIPETNMRVPLDLIYLDEDCRVIEVVESFPTFHVTSRVRRRQAFWRCRPTRSIRRRPSRAINWCSAWPRRCSAAWSSSPAQTALRGGVQSARSVAGKAALERRSRRGGIGGSLRRGALQIFEQPYEMALSNRG